MGQGPDAPARPGRLPLQIALWSAAGWALVLGAVVLLRYGGDPRGPLVVESWAYGRALVALPFLAAPLAERGGPGWRRTLLRSVVWAHAALGAAMIPGSLSAAVREALGR